MTSLLDMEQIWISRSFQKSLFSNFFPYISAPYMGFWCEVTTYWLKTDSFLSKNLPAIIDRICEFFWTTCISSKGVGQKRTVFCPKTSRRLSIKSVNFFEHHVFLVRVLAKNGHFFVRKPPGDYLWIFLNIMYFEEFLCVFFYTSPCSAREAGLRPASLTPRLE